MPQPSKGARLFLRKRKGREPVYVIRDAGFEQSTGTADSQQAEIALAQYIASKTRRSGPSEAHQLTVAECLTIYGEEHAPSVSDPARIGYAIDALLTFWGDMTCADIKGSTVRLYQRQRAVAVSTVRRELSVLRAALNYCGREGYLLSVPMFPLPASPETNQRALTRSEAATLIRTARRLSRDRKDLDYRHAIRFILISLYTGTRKSATLNMRLSGPALHSGWFDLDAGLMYRKGTAERSTNKRRTPARIPRQLLAHLKRWKKNGATWAVEYKGDRIADIKTAFNHIVTESGLGFRITPHTLKHTAITWTIQNGSSIADAAAFFATSPETIERVYWHLSPFFQDGALRAIEGQSGAKLGRGARA